jgi:general secretion pathway protein K
MTRLIRPNRARLLRSRAQRGAALLLAMIILTLVATLAANMVWQQSTSVAVEAAERARAQSTWIMNGALDWSRIILREDARNRGGSVDHLGEPWATPLAEARLSSFLAADKDNSSDGNLEAFLSGSIEDAQSRYNLRSLFRDNEKGSEFPMVMQKEELDTLTRLFKIIELPDGLADVLANGLLDAWSPAGPNSNDVPLAPKTLAQLRWLGINEATIARLQPYVTVLPKSTTINLNTATSEVIAAVTGSDVGMANRLVQHRVRTPFNTVDEALTLLPGRTIKDPKERVGVSSSFFEVRGRLRLEDQIQEDVALMERRDIAVVPIWRIRSQMLQGR